MECDGLRATVVTIEMLSLCEKGRREEGKRKEEKKLDFFFFFFLGKQKEIYLGGKGNFEKDFTVGKRKLCSLSSLFLFSFQSSLFFSPSLAPFSCLLGGLQHPEIDRPGPVAKTQPTTPALIPFCMYISRKKRKKEKREPNAWLCLLLLLLLYIVGKIDVVI